MADNSRKQMYWSEAQRLTNALSTFLPNRLLSTHPSQSSKACLVESERQVLQCLAKRCMVAIMPSVDAQLKNVSAASHATQQVHGASSNSLVHVVHEKYQHSLTLL